MKKILNYVMLLFCLILVVFITSCDTREESDNIKFTDCSGTVIEMNKQVDRIISVDQSCTSFLIGAGLSSKIVGLHGSMLGDKWTPYFMGEELSSIKKFGYKPSAEAIYEKQADLVLLNDAAYAQELRKSGVNAVCFKYANIDELYYAVDMLGNIFGNEVKTYIDNWKKYVDKTITELNINLSSLKEADRKNVYYINASNNPSDLYSTFGGDSFYEYWMNTVGANLITSEYKNITSVQPEIILAKNPGTIIIGGYAEYSRKETLIADPLWANIDAIKNNDIHLLPTSFAGYEKFSLELPLLLKYTANKLYPELCDFNGINELRKFYNDFYNIEFSDELLNNLMLGLYPDGTRKD